MIPIDSMADSAQKYLAQIALSSKIRASLTQSKFIDYVLVYNSSKIDEENNHSAKLKTNRKSRRRAKYRKFFLDNLKLYGLKTKKVVENDKTVFILIYTPFDKLLEIAEKTKLKLPIEINQIKSENVLTNFWHNRIKSRGLPQELKEEKDIKYFTAPYSSNLHQQFAKFFNSKNLEDTFLFKDRCLLTYELLSRTCFSKAIKTPNEIFENNFKEEETKKTEKGDLIGLDRLLANGTFQAAFPLHEEFNPKQKVPISNATRRQLLWDYWASPRKILAYQPFNLITEYFGEKLGFYFAWLGHYTNSLFIPSIFGLMVFIYGCVNVFNHAPTNEICDLNLMGNTTMCPMCNDNNCKVWKLNEICLYSRLAYLIDNPLTIIFSFCMALWTVLFIDFWKRRQAYLQFEWDTLDYEKVYETTRPEFEQKVKSYKVNPITGVTEPHVPFFRKFIKYFLSVSGILLMLLLVLAFFLGVIVYSIVVKAMLSRSDTTKAYSSAIVTITSGLINLIIIIILGHLYSFIAVKLTDIEFHRTDSNYEDSLTIKMYLFQFVNFYASIFYIAFFKERNLAIKLGSFIIDEQCDSSGCMTELGIQLAIIMVGKQVLNNIQEILFPIIQVKFAKLWNKNKTNANNNPTSKSQWAKDLNLMKWTHLTLFDEYLEMIIQYGFMTLFIVAFPLGPLFSFINNVLEIRIDAFKFLTQYRRPLPKKSQDIGIWMTIISAISKLGIVVNAFIIAFTSEFLPKLIYYFKYQKMDGYVKYSLSIKNLSDFQLNSNLSESICYYKDFREPYDSPNKYSYTTEYYLILCVRLAFIIIFEHVVFSSVEILHWLIPNVPKVVRDQIERENLIKQQAMWQMSKTKDSKVSRRQASFGSRRLMNTFDEENDEEELDLNYDEDLIENEAERDDEEDIV